jgi:hypothetical protein
LKDVEKQAAALKENAEQKAEEAIAAVIAEIA